MRTEVFTFRGSGGTGLFAMLWTPAQPKAVLQITHGMMEHIGRYRKLAEFLCDHQIAVAGFDLRGHGHSPGPVSETGSAAFGEGGWEACLEDLELFYQLLDRRFPKIPHVLLGFSLGSFLLRERMRCGGSASGLLLLGTGYQSPVMLATVKKFIHMQVGQCGFDNTSELIKKLLSLVYNEVFSSHRTPFDWLCFDEQEVDRFIGDPLCRDSISTGLFEQLLDAMRRTGLDDYTAWPKNLPVLLLSGMEDTVANRKRGIRKVLQAMKATLSHADLILIPGARHDLLHEYASGAADEAFQAILSFINSLCTAPQ